MSEPASKCPVCGGGVPAGAPEGLCPKCLLLGASAATEGSDREKAAAPPLDTMKAAFPQLEIIQLIGQGGMGCVFKARQPQLQRLVALKILPPAFGRDPAFAERFTREARALAMLNHPGIVTIHDFGQSSGFYFLLMEFVDGVNLRQALSRGRFTPEQALAVVPPVCEALQFAHERGIVHRDIKPENLLLDKAGRLKIADFGIAKMVGAAGSAEERPAGTPRYMAPEQKENGRQADHRADIYSLGVVLYEMLTGEAPPRPMEPPSGRVGGVQIDVRLDQVVLRALERSPELRWQTAAAMRTQLERISEERAQTPLSAGAGVPAKEGVNISHRAELVRILALCLPSAVFAWFILLGYAVFGLDLDADVRAWTGLIGFPLSAGFGAVLAWVVGPFQGTSGQSVGPRRAWALNAIGALLLLAGSVLLMGGGMVLLSLVAQEPNWNPSSPGNAPAPRAELITFLVFSVGGLIAAACATLLGWVAWVRLRREPHRWRGWRAAFAAAWFWPGVAAGLLLLSLPLMGTGYPSAAEKAAAEAARERELNSLQVLRAAEEAERMAVRSVESVPPVVVETEPLAGVRDVPPGVMELRVRFSKAMAEGSWSWVEAWNGSVPEMLGEPRYENPRTCTLSVKLEPGRTYAIWLNVDNFQNFMDKAGNPAVPYLLIFRTLGEERSP